MKEAFWGVLIISLGLLGIVIVNLFQKVTVNNDRVYYVLKESSEAAAFDAVDLTNYRLTGNLRMVEDKFVENLTRRFAENITIGNYRIIVEDINEIPPKVSVRVENGIKSLQGEDFNLLNRVDAILETKYSLEDVLKFLEITEEEWNERIKQTTITGGGEENVCKVIPVGSEDLECITGDIKFVGWDKPDVKDAVCQDEKPKYNVERKARYKYCDCGKWSKEQEEKTYANPVRVGDEYVYTWYFKKEGKARSIDESIKERTRIDICTTGIEVWVPKEIEDKAAANAFHDKKVYEPSGDNSGYKKCPPEGIRIPKGMKFVAHPYYIPENATNRTVYWSTANKSIVKFNGILSNNGKVSVYTKNGLAKAQVETSNVGKTNITNKTTRDQYGSCNIKVWDGTVDSVSCANLELNYGGSSGIMRSSYSPANATQLNFKWSISDSSIASINSNNGVVTPKKAGTTTVTVTAPGGKTGTCSLKINPGTPMPGGGYYYYGGPCSYVWHDEYVDRVTKTNRYYGPGYDCGCLERYPLPPGYPANAGCRIYNSCWHYNYYYENEYKDVTYNGQTKVEIIEGACTNEGWKRVIKKTKCIFNRNYYYPNPGQAGEYNISVIPSNEAC